MPLSKIFQILFIVDSTFIFFFILECLNKSMVVFLVIILGFWRTKKSFSSKSYPFSKRFVILACCHPLIIVLDCENSFHPSREFKILFSLILRRPSFRFIHSSFKLSFSKSYRCIVQYPLTSSWSLRSFVSISSQAPSFIC